MPVRQFSRTPVSDASTQLTKDLIREWGAQDSAAREPVILIENFSPSIQHVYVVWDAWKDLPQVERSEIIMDAAEQVVGAPAPLNITVAMGLTPAEADRMGIQFR